MIASKLSPQLSPQHMRIESLAASRFQGFGRRGTAELNNPQYTRASQHNSTTFMLESGSIQQWVMILFTARFSAYGQRVAIALKEKQIPFEVIEVHLGNKPQELLEANPIYKRIPTIIHNGKAVAESLIILQYLEEAFPVQVPLISEDAFGKSKVRFWIDYVNKAFSALSTGLPAKSGNSETQVAKQEANEAIRTLEAGMISFSADGPFFAGDKFGLLDVALAPLIMTLPLFRKLGGIEIPGPDKAPRLHRWIEAVKVHPSVSSTIPPEEENLAYAKIMFRKAGLMQHSEYIR